MLPVSQKLVLLHSDRGLTCKCHSCAGIALWSSLLSHGLRVSTVVALTFYYGNSEPMHYILSVLVDDAYVCRSTRPWDSFNECTLPPVQNISTVIILDIGLDVRSKQNPDDISKGWLVCFSEQERVIKQSWWVAA